MPGLEYAYSHDSHMFADNGLQLRLPVDKVPANQYSRLTNVVPLVEGRLVQRPGTTSWLPFTTVAPVHTIFRLNQSVPSVVSSYLAGVGAELHAISVPTPTAAPVDGGALSGLSFSGNRLTIVSFRYDNDTASWAIIGDSAGMMKYRPGTSPSNGYYQGLGIPAPTVSASASAGGAGNLDSTGGTGYDWLYTWLNRVTGSEGNPTPINFTGGATAIKRPTSNTNPDAAFGGSGFTNPANAYDGTDVNFASGTSASATELRQSCRWGTWAASGGTPNNLAIQVDAQVIVTGTLGTCLVAFYYSTDGGTTWKTLFTATSSQARQVYIAPIPPGIAFSQLTVRATVLASGLTGDTSGHNTDRSNVIRNRLLSRGGDFDNISDLLNGGGGNRTITLKVFDINSGIVYIGSAASPLVLAAQSANVCVTSPTATQDPSGQVGSIRLYRRGGSLPDTWRQVGEYPISSLVQGGCGVGTLQINDNIADSGLGAIIALDNDMPVTSVSQQAVPLPHIWGPFDNRVLGCGDPNRPESVYFSKRGNADQWSSAAFVVVADPGEPILNGCVYNTRTFAFSGERMFELVPNLIGGVTFTPYPTPCSRGLIAPHAVCVGPAVYFVSKDGIYATTGGEQVSLTFDSIQPLFPTYDSPGAATNGYDAVDMTVPESLALEYHNGEIWFTYQGVNDAQTHQLVYDIERKRWRAVNYSPGVFTVYSERGLVAPVFTTLSGIELLMGTIDGNVINTSFTTADHAGAANIACNVRTGSHDQGQPLNQKEYGDVLFDLDPQGQAVTITPYINGEAVAEAALIVNGTGRQQVALSLTDIFAYNVAFDITWGNANFFSPVLYQYDILWRREPVSVTHWETRETSHGLPGWQHVKDAYVTLRSTSSVTMTITIDNDANRTYVYTIPSTNGQRQKVYVPFQANKGKLFHYAFDAAQQFRLYEPDVEVRVSAWTSAGYKDVKPFGEETITLADYRLPMNA